MEKMGVLRISGFCQTNFKEQKVKVEKCHCYCWPAACELSENIYWGSLSVKMAFRVDNCNKDLLG